MGMGENERQNGANLVKYDDDVHVTICVEFGIATIYREQMENIIGQSKDK